MHEFLTVIKDFAVFCEPSLISYLIPQQILSVLLSKYIQRWLFLTTSTVTILVQATNVSHMKYLNSFLRNLPACISSTAIHSNTAARLVLSKHRSDYITRLLTALHWLSDSLKVKTTNHFSDLLNPSSLSIPLAFSNTPGLLSTLTQSLPLVFSFSHSSFLRCHLVSDG